MDQTATVAPDVANKIAILNEFTISTVYIMGFSFVAGSAVTVLCLLLLDYIRDSKQQKMK